MCRSLEQLISIVEAGCNPDYLFFWGHHQSGNIVDKSCLSQWYEAAFELDGEEYKSAEHYMMAQKAYLFNDSITYRKILEATTPEQAKQLGRSVQGFKSDIWARESFDIVVRGNIGKFAQNPSLRNFLISTGEMVLVEASPVDSIWGIGLAANHDSAKIPAHWPGKNLLGFALMAVRENLQNI